MNIAHVDEIYADAFGSWISGLFSAIGGRNPGLSFDEHKGAFFDLLRRWLDEDKIRFCAPDDPLDGVWDAPADDIIQFLQDRWPAGATHENDPALNLYFYEMPALLWVDRSGKLYGS